MEILIFWLIMATIVGMVGKSKGRGLWPVGLVHALLLRQEPGTTPGL